jgi:SAM-dependent methyltransferase
VSDREATTVGFDTESMPNRDFLAHFEPVLPPIVIGPYHRPLMNQPMDDSYLKPYRESLAEHGTDFKVTLWASPRAQTKRFEVLTQMCFFAGKRILDAGCGRGDFAAFLCERHTAFERYVGVDALPDLIAFASSRRLPGCEFHCGDFVVDPSLLSLGKPQVVCICGALNTMDEARVMMVLEAAWAAASEALLFNFLSSRARVVSPVHTGPARRLDPLRLLDWAMGHTPAVSFRQDYFKTGHDATILMRKPSSGHAG